MFGYMNWSNHEHRMGRRGYHHGNLREALVQAAMELIAEKGPAGFTFADAARWAGVSSAAPYRHFRDREALLADVARRGFEQFESELAVAWNDGKPEPLAAVAKVGRAYLAFARSQPAYYGAMFSVGLDYEKHEELNHAADRAFAILRRAAEAISLRVPVEARPPALMMSLHVWAMSHGIATLFIDSSASTRKLPMNAEDLLEAGVLIYLRGLGLIGGTALKA